MTTKPPKLPNRSQPKPTPFDSTLTPLRVHYLKRQLVTLQFTEEIKLINESPSALSLLGSPFLPYDQFLNGVPTVVGIEGSLIRLNLSEEESTELPFLRFVLNHFVLTFPFLANCSPSFFSHKLQPFIYSFLSRNISSDAFDDGEENLDNATEASKRKKLVGKVEKHLGLIMSAAIKITENDGKEEVVRVKTDGTTYAATPSGEPALPVPNSNGIKDSILITKKEEEFTINVVAVRNILTKGRVMNKSHEEFIVRTRKLGAEDVFVARRYGDFSRLAETLRKECIEADVRSPPAKDRRTSELRPSPTHSRQNSMEFTSPPHSPNPGSSSPPSMPTLSRERNRLTLRAYLRTLFTNPVIAASSAFQTFLLESPISLTAEEQRDILIREEMDRVREEEVKRFREEVEERVGELERGLRGFREELVQSDGLTRVFGTIRRVEKVEDLPEEYRKVLEWGRISLASTIYSLFLGSDTSSASFTSLKRTHSIMPYFVMRQILKISNPIAMVRSILDLFLARPFGSTSLIQKMFSGGLVEEVSDLREQAGRVGDKVDDEAMVRKISEFVEAPKEVQDEMLADSIAENQDIISIILRSSSSVSPPLSSSSIQRVQRASVAYAEYKFYRSQLSDPDDDEGPSNEDGWLFEDLHVLLRLLRKARDKEQLIQLIFEGSTSELLKDIVTIFYEPLAKVYKAANIADSLYDLQMFIGDLIKTVETAEEANLSDPQKTVQIFVSLVERHEGRFYNFIHQVHSKGEGLFDNLMKWIELFINFVKDGLPNPISLEYLLPVTGIERTRILKEVDGIIAYHEKVKIAHQDRMKRRLIRGENLGVEEQKRKSDDEFIGGVMMNLNMNGVLGGVEEFREEDSEEEDEENQQESEEEEDEKSLPNLPGLINIKSNKKIKKLPILPPKLNFIPSLLPIFVLMVREELNTQHK